MMELEIEGSHVHCLLQTREQATGGVPNSNSLNSLKQIMKHLTHISLFSSLPKLGEPF